jgi:hypothetical protein
MKKILYLIIFLLSVTIVADASAAEKTAGRSAQLAVATVSNSTEKNISDDARVIAMRNVLIKYNSVLAPEAENFVYYADKHGIDWRLLVSISGLESGYASRYVQGSYNAYGWGGGYIYFDSWENGIDSISRSLRKNYYDRGADTIEKIGPIYAENPHWAERIYGFTARLDKEYSRITTLATLTAAPQF